MQATKNQKETPTLTAVQTKHPRKTCTCVACDPPKPKLPKGTRRLKIQPKYYQRLGHLKTFPSILLSGKWLQDQGFECDSYVIIAEKKGQLVIKLQKE